jgi:DNA repair protein RadC
MPLTVNKSSIVIALSKTDLLAILLGSGIKGINVQTLAKTIITKFNKDFLNITIDDLLTFSTDHNL